MRSRPEEFLHVFGELEPEPIEVAFESSFGWGLLADLLADAGIRPTLPILWRPRPSRPGVKNDAVDAPDPVTSQDGARFFMALSRTAGLGKWMGPRTLEIQDHRLYPAEIAPRNVLTTPLGGSHDPLEEGSRAIQVSRRSV